MRVQGNLTSLSMFMVVVGIALAMGTHAPDARADTIVIDSFASPGAGHDFYSFTIDPLALPAIQIVPTQPTDYFEGGRNLSVTVDNPVDWKSVAGTIGSTDEVLSVATWGNAGSKVMLDYNTAGKAINSDLTDGGTNDAIAFAFNFLEAGNIVPGNLNIQIAVTSGGDTAMFNSSTSAMGDVTPSIAPFVYNAAFADFDMIGPLTNAESITITFNEPMSSNLDFEVTSIAAVPEPSTLAMLLTVGAASMLVGIRRRRKS